MRAKDRRAITLMDEARIRDVAERYVAILREWLTPEEMDAVRSDDDVRNEHDFCDANMALLAAFEDVVRVSPDAGDDEQVAVMNRVAAMGDWIIKGRMD